MIASVHANCFIFERGFKPAKTRNAKPEVKINIPDQGGLLANSQLLDPKDLKKRNSVSNSLLSKRTRMMMELQRMQEREEKLKEATAKKMADLEAYNSEDDDFTSVKISLEDY